MLRRFAKGWAWFENLLVVLILTAMLLLAVLQVILRNGFDAGIDWADAFQQYGLLWLGFLGAQIASRERKHICVDAFLMLLPERIRGWTSGLSAVFAAGVCVLGAWCSGLLVEYEKESAELAFGSIPLWWCIVIMPISFAVMGCRALIGIRSQRKDVP